MWLLQRLRQDAGAWDAVELPVELDFILSPDRFQRLQELVAAPAALALAAGIGLALQGPVNAQLQADLDAPVTAGAFSFLVATAAMLVVVAAVPRVVVRPTPAAVTRMPLWGWLGGLCGATYVTAVFVLIPEIGAAPTIALTVAGQQLASVLVDRHGLLRLPRRPIPPLRLLGVCALLAGVAVIQFA
jgi:transporter family-2 protein